MLDSIDVCSLRRSLPTDRESRFGILLPSKISSVHAGENELVLFPREKGGKVEDDEEERNGQIRPSQSTLTTSDHTRRSPLLPLLPTRLDHELGVLASVRDARRRRVRLSADVLILCAFLVPSACISHPARPGPLLPASTKLSRLLESLIVASGSPSEVTGLDRYVAWKERKWMDGWTGEWDDEDLWAFAYDDVRHHNKDDDDDHDYRAIHQHSLGYMASPHWVYAHTDRNLDDEKSL
ncbi:hypothetical protein NMY22_g11550 [Coprinellus aureogranulatus]|nr:hypothetical protein NMY22_g11550 [Coprinellus aureogranulatus]